MNPGEKRIRILRDGPYSVKGRVPLAKQVIVTDEAGESVEWRETDRYPERETYILCRCGASGTKPYCDGTHTTIGFDGTETASRQPYAERAERIEGPGAVLMDERDLCAEARFCAARGRIWRTIAETDDPAMRERVMQQAALCPSGRYTACDKETGEPFEPVLEPSIGLVEDPVIGLSGGLWVRGGIPVESAEGFTYEQRNRVTLCRCGQSKNKPFCDGTHCEIGFNDGL